MLYNFHEVDPHVQEIRLRKLNKGNCRLALPLLEAQYREHDIDLSGPRLLKAMRTLVDGNGVLLLAGSAGVAELSWQFSLERAGRVAWMEELYVAPDHRGKGLGSRLIERAVQEARKAGCVTVELEVVRGHERAAKLYLREGFALLPRRRYSRRLK
ncbi:MAG TPA: GNAT family N-acetyltransferase [Myxococcales bacterium]|jgi:GNAT superfamily N-acetyltransferase|nr:GNAT family N-acetyltransferase [Myxococcales bacterium]